MTQEPAPGANAGARHAVGPRTSPPGCSQGQLRRSVRAHLETWRPYTLAYPGIVGLAGAAAGGGPVAGAHALIAACGPMLGWLGGHYLGDYYDRYLDAIGKAQRPIPSGRLAPGTARACGLLAVLAAGGITILIDPLLVLVVLLALAGITAYSKILKGRHIWGNAVRGTLTALAVLYGAAVAAPPGEPPSWRAVPVAVVVLLHDTSTNLVGTLRDIDGDRAGGYRTLPVQRGPRFATRTAAVLYTAALLLAAGTAVPAAHPAAYLLLLLAAAMGVQALHPLLKAGAHLTPPDGLARA